MNARMSGTVARVTAAALAVDFPDRGRLLCTLSPAVRQRGRRVFPGDRVDVEGAVVVEVHEKRDALATTLETLGLTLRELREEIWRLPCKRVGARAGVSPQSVAAYERNRTGCQERVRVALDDAYLVMARDLRFEPGVAT
jgi:hypothetical protein